MLESLEQWVNKHEADMERLIFYVAIPGVMLLLVMLVVFTCISACLAGVV